MCVCVCVLYIIPNNRFIALQIFQNTDHYEASSIPNFNHSVYFHNSIIACLWAG